jgi:hypothetical protein
LLSLDNQHERFRHVGRTVSGELCGHLYKAGLVSQQTTTATPEQYVAGLTDFGPGRSKLFGNSADEYLKVHDRGGFEADVTGHDARARTSRVGYSDSCSGPSARGF